MKFLKFLHRGKSTRKRPGQMGVLFLIMVPVLLGFAGLSIDLGNAYRTRATSVQSNRCRCTCGDEQSQPRPN